MTIERSWALILVSVVAGCASSGDKQTPGTGGVSLADAPAEIAKAVCPKAYTCCVASQLMGNDLAGTDEPSCEAKTTEGFRKQLSGLQGSLDKGRAVYRGDKMAACIAHIRSATCEELNRTNHFSGVECEPYLEPQVALGGTCGHDYECIGGVCHLNPMSFEGECRPFVQAGESCADARCGEGTICDGTSKICVTILGEGAMCMANTDCASGICSAPFGGAKSCAPPPPDKCFYSSACAYDGRPISASAATWLALIGLAAAYGRRRRARAGTSRRRNSNSVRPATAIATPSADDPV